VATPELLRVALPKLVDPWVKLTVPAGVPSAEVTVAVKVTLAPEAAVLEEEASVMVVADGVVLVPPPVLPVEPLLEVEPLLPPPHPESRQAATMNRTKNTTTQRWP
jgi:hypothetical protein